MENIKFNTSHSHIQQLPSHLTTQTKTANTTQNSNATPQPKTPKTTKNEPPSPPHHTYKKSSTYTTQHKHQNRLQMQQRISTAHQTSHQPQHPTPQQKWGLPINLRNLQPLVCRSNQPEPEDPLPRKHQIHKN